MAEFCSKRSRISIPRLRDPKRKARQPKLQKTFDPVRGGNHSKSHASAQPSISTKATVRLRRDNKRRLPIRDLLLPGGDDPGLSSISTIVSLSRCVFALFRVIRVIRVIRGSKVFSPFFKLRRENLVKIVEGAKHMKILPNSRH